MYHLTYFSNPDNYTEQEKVDTILSDMYDRQQRVRLFYGDTDTGGDWLEEYDTMGKIGKSTGRKPIYILVHNARSYGDAAILTDCIVRIQTQASNGKYVDIYRHPHYWQPDYQIKAGDLPNIPWEVSTTTPPDQAGVVARFEKFPQAYRYILFMQGDRARK